MTHLRKDVWKLGNGWNDTLLWYAKAVGAMQDRRLDDTTGWRFLAAMHGIDPDQWRDYGYLSDADTPPSRAVQQTFWQQCQHQSWFFLPWHRGYLAAFEAIVRKAVVDLGGPSDWALPYWNYSDAKRADVRKLPFAFGEKKLPDGKKNPLYVERRYGLEDGGELDPRIVQLGSLNDSIFTGGDFGASAGFGGPATMFHHGAGTNGGLESQPHNPIHGAIGGNDGLMSYPSTAALDPIFWLHHANIDRLWDVWLTMNHRHLNPTDRRWLLGPTSGRKFTMPGTANGTHWDFTAKDMLDTKAHNLDYTYEDISSPFPAPRLVARLDRLGMGAVAPQAESQPVSPHKPELLGASAPGIKLGTAPFNAKVALDSEVTRKVVHSFTQNFGIAGGGAREPDRVFLNIENITGKNDAATYHVYLDLPPGADPKDHPQNLAGSISLFGVRNASLAEGSHAGNGLSVVLEITPIVDALHLGNKLDAAHLDVRFVPDKAVRAGDDISVGRISVYRQGH